MTDGPAVTRVVDALREHGCAPRKTGDKWAARCPSHPDNRPSLGVWQGDRGAVLKCQVGCDNDMITTELGLTMADLFDQLRQRRDEGEWTPHGPAVAVYDYRDEAGALLFQVCRTADKQFSQRRPDPAKRSGWAWNLNGTRRVLYRLTETIEAVRQGREVWITEGEKDADRLAAMGLPATCNPGGAGKWRDEYAQVLAGAVAMVVADRDNPGHRHAGQVAASLRAVGATVTVVEAAEGKDASDHITAGHGLDEFRPVADPEPAEYPDTDPWADEPASDNGSGAESLTSENAAVRGDREGAAGVDVAELAHLRTHTRELSALLAEDDEPYDWVVPGLIERGDRIILTGPEGGGKSTWMRQTGVQCAAGIHPLSLQPMRPVRVCIVDLENSQRQTRRKTRSLFAAAGDRYKPEPGLHVVHRPGLDLHRAGVGAALLEYAREMEPEILIIGPLYKMADGDPTEEIPAKLTAGWLDRIRDAVGCALLIEAHSPHASNGNRRPIRPYGASLWLRWPEFGIYLGPDGQVEHWRGPRDERAWPRSYVRGGNWPWTVAADDTEDEALMRSLRPSDRVVLTTLRDCAISLTTGMLRQTLLAAGHGLSERTVRDCLQVLGKRGLAVSKPTAAGITWRAASDEESRTATASDGMDSGLWVQEGIDL